MIGGIIVAGTSRTGSFAAVARFNNDGALDTSFGPSGNGRVTVAATYGYKIKSDSVSALTDGKLLLSGTTGGNVALFRFTSTGRLDTTFGTGGTVSTDVAATDYGYDLTVQPDQKILVTGISAWDGNHMEWALIRYNAANSKGSGVVFFKRLPTPLNFPLSWTNTSQTAAGYNVYRSTDGGRFTYLDYLAGVNYADTTYYSDTTAVAGTQYWYRVTARDASYNESAPSRSAMDVTPPMIGTTSDSTVVEGSLYTLNTSVAYAAGEVDPVRGWTINWGDGTTTNALGLANGDPGSFTHFYNTTGFYTITASTIDGAFTGTKDVEATYDDGGATAAERISVTSSNPNSDGSPSDPTAGVAYSLTAVHTDPAGHHVNTWVINWGDGTIDTFGGSDTSTDGSSSDPHTTDTKTFTHTFPDAPLYPYSSVTISAVTDENVYQWSAGLYVHGDVSWSSDTLAVAAFGTNGTDGSSTPAVVDGVADADVGAVSAPPGTFTVDWGDGSATTGFYNSAGTAISPPHQYNRAGTYIVTMTEHTDAGADLTGHAMMPIAANPTASPDMPPLVLSAGAALGITEAATAASGDPLFATIEFGDGTGPRVVPVSGGVVDLTAVHAPSHLVGLEPTFGVSTEVRIYNATTAGVKVKDFTTDVWTAMIDTGESNDLLIASPDGTHNLQPVTFYFPHPAGVAYDITVTDSAPTFDDLWLNGSPTPGATPLCGGSNSTFTYTTDPTQSSSSFDTGAFNGDVVLNPLDFIFAGVQNIGASTSGSTSASSSAATQRVSPAELTIYQDGQNPGDVSGLTQNWLIGRYVRLEADWIGPMDVSILGASKFTWSVPGKTLYTINESDDKSSRLTIPLKADNGPGIDFIGEVPNARTEWGTSQIETKFFWVSTDDSTTDAVPYDSDVITLDATIRGRSLHATTTFHVFSPAWDTNVSQGFPGIWKEAATGTWKVGLPGIGWAAAADVPAGFAAGGFYFVQKITLNRHDVDVNGTGSHPPYQGFTVLDDSDPYKFTVHGDSYNGSDGWTTNSGSHGAGDAPASDLDHTKQQTVLMNDSFKTYLMFKPIGGAAVPLASESWSFYIGVDQTPANSGIWSLVGTPWRNIPTKFVSETVEPEWLNKLASPFVFEND